MIPLLGSYDGAGDASGAAAFAGETDATTSLYSDYLQGSDGWPIEVGTQGSPPWVISQVKGNLGTMRLELSVPLQDVPGEDNAQSLASYAANPSLWDAEFTILAQNLVAAGFGNAIIRLMWEPDALGTYANEDLTTAANYAAVWRDAHAAMASVAGANFGWAWYWSFGFDGTTNETAYPGTADVDYVSLDFYDQSWVSTCGIPYNGSAFSAAQETCLWSAPNGYGAELTDFSNFATIVQKPMAFGEWGVITRDDNHGGGDDPTFVDEFAAWMKSHNVSWASYFDFNSGGNSTLADYPNSLAAYRADLGGGSGSPTTTTTQPPAPSPSTTTTSVPPPPTTSTTTTLPPPETTTTTTTDPPTPTTSTTTTTTDPPPPTTSTTTLPPPETTTTTTDPPPPTTTPDGTGQGDGGTETSAPTVDPLSGGSVRLSSSGALIGQSKLRVSGSHWTKNQDSSVMILECATAYYAAASCDGTNSVGATVGTDSWAVGRFRRTITLATGVIDANNDTCGLPTSPQCYVVVLGNTGDFTASAPLGFTRPSLSTRRSMGVVGNSRKKLVTTGLPRGDSVVAVECSTNVSIPDSVTANCDPATAIAGTVSADGEAVFAPDRITLKEGKDYSDDAGGVCSSGVTCNLVVLDGDNPSFDLSTPITFAMPAVSAERTTFVPADRTDEIAVSGFPVGDTVTAEECDSNVDPSTTLASSCDPASRTSTTATWGTTTLSVIVSTGPSFGESGSGSVPVGGTAELVVSDTALDESFEVPITLAP